MTTLPNLLIVGVKKAGTSSLFDYLSQHPDICASRVKETGYFSTLVRDNGSLRPPRYYEGFFTDCGGETYRLEATPDYFYGGSRVVRAIARTLQDPRLVVTLRDPVTRLWSHYKMKQTKGSETTRGMSFEEYVRRCEAAGREADGSYEARGYAALAQGRYADHVGEWFETFGDRFRVVFLESWSRRPRETMVDLTRWLGIDEDVVTSFDYSVTNQGAEYASPAVARAARKLYKPVVRTLHRHPRRRRLLRSMGYLRTVHDVVNPPRRAEDRGGEMEPDTRDHLDEVYRASNRRLGQELIRRGYRDLPSWLSLSLAEG